MTHTLHRFGSSENLSNDYVILCMAAIGHNDTNGCMAKLSQFLEICMKYNPVNIGDMQVGNMYSHSTDEIVKNPKSIVHAVFTKLETVTEVLREIKEADLKMSVVVSGIHEEVIKAIHNAGLKNHTVNFSLGIWGKIETLPKEEVLEITTMCGHGLIPPDVVKMAIKEVSEGKTKAEDAAKQLAPNCACGVFNPNRTASLLKSAAEKFRQKREQMIEV